MFKSIKQLFAVFSIAAIFAFGAIYAQAQTTAFTYQGRLTDNSAAANGSYDMQFLVYTAATGGTQQGFTVTKTAVPVSNGVFSVQLDMSNSPFAAGDNRFLEIRVRLNNSGGGYTTLLPRQQITSTPYAIQSVGATFAVNAFNSDALGNVPANQFVQTNDARLTDARTPTSGSANYVQNSATTQAGTTNFNINGSGTVGGTLTTFNASVSNNLNVQGNVNSQGTITGNQFSGVSAILSGNFSANNATVNGLTVNGATTVTGGITGNGANISGLNATNITLGTLNTARIPNLDAGKITTGTFGTALIPNLDAGKITTGEIDARLSSNIPRLNAANNFSVTQSAEIFNATAQFNLNGFKFISASGTANTFVGNLSGTNNIGQSNSFFGSGAGYENTSGNFNSFFGNFAGTNNDGGNSNSFFGYNAGLNNNTGGSNTFVGFNAGRQNQMGNNNSIYGWSAGNLNSTGNDNTFVGSNAGSANTIGNNNTVIGAGADLGANDLIYATALGAGAVVSESDTTVIGRENNFGKVVIPSRLIVTRTITFFRGSGGGSQPLCSLGVDTFPGAVVLSACGSSLRYKKDVENFTSGLDLVKRLRPVTFTWKSDNQRDLGFVAEEVAAEEPLMATYNEKGEVEGVKYDRISAALVNAVNEQQGEIKQQKELIERQQKQIDALVKLLCAGNAKADICQSEVK